MQERVNLAIAAALETKAEDVLLFDLENRSPLTDYVLVCSGRSQAHVRGIAENIEKALREAGIRCQSLEGLQEGSWVLMDYDVVFVHIFHPETRAYYNLESLLKGNPMEAFEDAPPEPPQVDVQSPRA